MPSERTSIAVAVCTRDRPVQLARALRSLQAQEGRPATVLVVDNAPTSSDAEHLVRRDFPRVRYVREDTQGLDFARNRALREATEQVVAFLDDDAVADAAWVECIGTVFDESESIALCTGKVDPLFMETAGQRLFEANGGFARGNRRIVLPPAGNRRLHGVPAPLIAWSISVGSGCSLAVRRKTALALGGFDVALDLGDALPGGGDLDIIWRTARAGHMVVYDPRVQARHEHRSAVHDTVAQILGHNQSLIVLLDKAVRSTRGRERASVLAFLAWRLLKPFVRLGRKAVGRDPLPISALMRLPVACWRGLGMYPRMREVARMRLAKTEHTTAGRVIGS